MKRIGILIISFLLNSNFSFGADSGLSSDSEYFERIVRGLVAARDWEALEEFTRRTKASTEGDDSRDESGECDSSVASGSTSVSKYVNALEGVPIANQKKLTLPQLIDTGVLSVDERFVFTLDFSSGEKFSDTELERIRKLFEVNDLFNLQEICLDGRPNAHEALKFIFEADKEKRCLFSLTNIRALDVKTPGSGELGKVTANLIYDHFSKYERFVRVGRQIGSYRVRGRRIGTYTIPIFFELTTFSEVVLSIFSNTLPLEWFEKEWDGGERFFLEGKIECHYKNGDRSNMARFYVSVSPRQGKRVEPTLSSLVRPLDHELAAKLKKKETSQDKAMVEIFLDNSRYSTSILAGASDEIVSYFRVLRDKGSTLNDMYKVVEEMCKAADESVDAAAASSSSSVGKTKIQRGFEKLKERGIISS